MSLQMILTMLSWSHHIKRGSQQRGNCNMQS